MPKECGSLGPVTLMDLFQGDGIRVTARLDPFSRLHVVAGKARRPDRFTPSQPDRDNAHRSIRGRDENPLGFSFPACGRSIPTEGVPWPPTPVCPTRLWSYPKADP